MRAVEGQSHKPIDRWPGAETRHKIRIDARRDKDGAIDAGSQSEGSRGSYERVNGSKVLAAGERWIYRHQVSAILCFPLGGLRKRTEVG